jgi:predicted nucleotidyltransferase
MLHKKLLENFKTIPCEHIPTFAEQYRLAILEVFGSDAQEKNSDLDIMVTCSKAPSILKFIWLENQIFDVLGKEYYKEADPIQQIIYR